MRGNRFAAQVLRRVDFLVILALILGACSGFGAQEMPVAFVPVGINPRATYVLAGPDATATPTPFQPIPPTPYPGGSEFPLPTPTPIDTPTPPAALVEIPQVTSTQEQQLTQLPNQLNILLIGVDQRPYDSGARTDTLILVTINTELSRVNITSFPRDLYVTLPGWGMNRINTAYVYGGIDMLKKTFKHNFGVKIDNYVLINFSSFKKVVDSLGGLDVNVAQPVSDYRAGYWVTIPSGLVHMDADLSLWYVRSRKTSNDFARNRRQQEVLQAIFERLLTLDALRRAPEFYEIYKKNVTTDLGLLDVLAWIPLATRIASSSSIHQYYINSKHVYDWISPEGGMVLLPNQDALMAVIRQSQNLP